MPRSYRQRARAEAAATTRRRILDAVRELVPGRLDLPVDEIARQAGVSVQTLYTHFGSKGRLLMAALDEVQREAGLHAGIGRVWQSRDGETALRRMIEATFHLWDRAWGFIEFSLRLRRTDPELGEEIGRLDQMRWSHLHVICRRLTDEDRLRSGREAAWATDLAFAMTTPTVYEELVRRRGWEVEAAIASVADAVAGQILEPGDAPQVGRRIDWAAYGLERVAVTDATPGGKMPA